MRFRSAPSSNRPREAVVPMINVVFLLLIFFLMTASITPAPPFDLNLPAGGGGEEATAGDALYLSEGGLSAFGRLRGNEAIAAAAAIGVSPVQIRADRDTPASEVAHVIARLQALGVTETQLVTERR